MKRLHKSDLERQTDFGFAHVPRPAPTGEELEEERRLRQVNRRMKEESLARWRSLFARSRNQFDRQAPAWVRKAMGLE